MTSHASKRSECPILNSYCRLCAGAECCKHGIKDICGPSAPGSPGLAPVELAGSIPGQEEVGKRAGKRYAVERVGHEMM